MLIASPFVSVLMCLHASQAGEQEGSTELSDTTALSVQANAAFILAVLAATGIASPHVAVNDSWAVKALHAAAQGGSAEANLALAHRYFMADGVPGNCQEGFRSAFELTAAMSCQTQTLLLLVCRWWLQSAPGW